MGTWNGVNVMYSPLADEGDFCEYLQCVRLRQQGEMQRRWGYQNTGIAKQGRVLNIAGANPVGGGFVIFEQPSGAVVGFETPPPARPRQPRKPIVTNPVCTIYTQSANGTTGTTAPFTLPVNACAGTLSVSGTENGGRARGDDYGYSFVATADGNPLLSSGCLVNAGSFATIPAGTLAVSVVVTAGCSGGATPGTWAISVTSP